MRTNAVKAEHEPNKAEFRISRAFDAPRHLVWKAWTTPELMAKWWGPRGCTIGKHTMDLRPGGIYHYCMMMNGGEMWGKFTYREVNAPERLVFVNGFSDEKGNLVRNPYKPVFPLEMLSVITFTEQAGKTTVDIVWTPLNATEEESIAFAQELSGMHAGWGGTLNQLADMLKEQA